MKRLILAAIISWMGVLLICPESGTATQSALNVITDRDHLNVGESLEIEVRLWSVMEGRVLPPLGGELIVAVIDALRGSAIRTFTARPDGSAQLFKVSWSPDRTGGYRIVARYENPSAGEQLAAETQVTVGLGPSRGNGRPSRPTAVATTTPAAYTSTTLPAPPTTVVETGTSPASVEGNQIPTRVVLRLDPGDERGEYVVRISVTTASGLPVEQGEVFITVNRGRLSRGGGNQIMVGLDRRGKAVLGWELGSIRGATGQITVDYLGGTASGQEYAPASSTLSLGGSSPVQVAEATTTTFPPAVTVGTVPVTRATLPPTTMATLPPTTHPPTTTTAYRTTTTTTYPPPTTTVYRPTTTTTYRPTTTYPATTTTTLPAIRQHIVRGQNMTNTLGMVFRLIPAGSFEMGSPRGRNAPRFASPVHRVEIGRPFWMGVHEVTQEQWTKVMGSRPSKFRGDPRRPVERVSPVQVEEFIKRLNAKEGTRAYRLPTEAEWEYACRAGTRTPWSFGPRPEQLSRFAWWISNSELKTHPVGQLEPNPWELFDMHGNIAELCRDWFSRDYYGQSPAKDPQGPKQGTHQVSRGGSWLSGPVRLQCASRVMAEPGPSLGFRLVRER